MNILIIGNGFDLAHGLPTKYEHFLKYVDAFKRFKDTCKQESVKSEWETANEEDKKFILHFANLYEQKTKIFKEIETLILNNVWINYFWEIYRNRGVAGKDSWIDFESEISRIIQTLDKARLTILENINNGCEYGKMTQRQLDILNAVFGEPKRNCNSIEFDATAIGHKKERLLRDLNRLTRCLEVYLSNYVEEIVPEVKLPDVDTLDIQYVLSFNYTHTYERFYDTDKSKKIHYDYIHGETRADSDIDNCNLILGVDEYLEGHAKDKDNEFIQFKNFISEFTKRLVANMLIG